MPEAENHSLERSFQWLGSFGQTHHPESLRKLLGQLGLMRIELDQIEFMVDALLFRLERGDQLSSKRLESIKMYPIPNLMALRWKLDIAKGDHALRLYLVREVDGDIGLRWHIKNLKLDSELLRTQQNLEITVAVIGYLEGTRKNY